MPNITINLPEDKKEKIEIYRQENNIDDIEEAAKELIILSIENKAAMLKENTIDD